MRQGVAIFAAAAVVAASLPYLREHDETLTALLSKAKIAVTGPSADEEQAREPLDPVSYTHLTLPTIYSV